MNLENRKNKISENPFKTPEGYFEQNKLDFLKKVNSQQDSPQKVVSIKKYSFREKAIGLIAVAASLVAFLLVWNSNNSLDSAAPKLSSIEISEIPAEYLDDEEIFALYETEFNDTASTPTIDYLIENEISLDLIAENI